MKIDFHSRIISAALLGLLFANTALAVAPPTTVEYQPMISTGLAANKPFESWFVFDKSFDPQVLGYEMPAGGKIRFTFPTQFSPEKDLMLGAVMIRWTQGAIPAKFAVAQDAKDQRVIEVQFTEALSTSGPGSPGIKAIHLRTPLINPKAGSYPILIEFIDAGSLTGSTRVTANITPAAVPNIAAYNQLHNNQNEDWQHVKPGTEASIPLDFLVTLPDQPRSTISLKTASEDKLSILSDGKPIGSISSKGAEISMTPQTFGPGYARLGIIELHAKAGTTQGNTQIEAKLDGGTQCVINLIID